MSVHDKDVCGETFVDLAKDLSTFLREKKVKDAIQRIQRCKDARLDATVHHGGMDGPHANVYNLVDYLHKCMKEIDQTVKFAESYGGKSSVFYEKTDDIPMRFKIKLSVKDGHRIYIIKSRGYKYDDTKY
jgi:hypothetical protein